MIVINSTSAVRGLAVSKNLRSGGSLGLDAIDVAILAELADDGRMANNAVAQRVGVAASTCLARIRALRESGVVRGVHADIDPAAVGLPLQAMIAVRVQAGSRDHLVDFADRVRNRVEVRSVYFLAGADDFLVHVAVADSAALQSFVVDQLSSHGEVALTETNLIFDYLPGAGLPG